MNESVHAPFGETVRGIYIYTSADTYFIRTAELHTHTHKHGVCVCMNER